jgi:hypothetical protein
MGFGKVSYWMTCELETKSLHIKKHLNTYFPYHGKVENLKKKKTRL